MSQEFSDNYNQLKDLFFNVFPNKHTGIEPFYTYNQEIPYEKILCAYYPTIGDSIVTGNKLLLNFSLESMKFYTHADVPVNENNTPLFCNSPYASEAYCWLRTVIEAHNPLSGSDFVLSESNQEIIDKVTKKANSAIDALQKNLFNSMNINVINHIEFTQTSSTATLNFCKFFVATHVNVQLKKIKSIINAMAHPEPELSNLILN